MSQSFAGRSGVLHLLPPSLDELRRFENAPRTLAEHYRSAAMLAERLRLGPPQAQVETVLVYGGDELQTRSDAKVLPWERVAEMVWD